MEILEMMKRRKDRSKKPIETPSAVPERRDSTMSVKKPRIPSSFWEDRLGGLSPLFLHTFFEREAENVVNKGVNRGHRGKKPA